MLRTPLRERLLSSAILQYHLDCLKMDYKRQNQSNRGTDAGCKRESRRKDFRLPHYNRRHQIQREQDNYSTVDLVSIRVKVTAPP